MGLLDAALRSITPELAQATNQIGDGLARLNDQLATIAGNMQAVALRLDRQDRMLAEALLIVRRIFPPVIEASRDRQPLEADRKRG